MLKAIIFDMDDTLLDWSQRSPDWYDHERSHLGRVYDFVSKTIQPIRVSLEHFMDVVRVNSRDSWLEAERTLKAPNYGRSLRSALIKVGVPEDQIDLNACLEAYDWNLISGVRVFPEVKGVLQTLYEHHIAIGMITNASVPMWLRDRELDACGLLPYFSDCRFAAVDIGYIKPHPQVFETALECLGITAEEAIYVGDNPDADVRGAQNVGMQAVLRRIKHRQPGIVPVKPDAIIDSLDELIPLVDSWYPEWRDVEEASA